MNSKGITSTSKIKHLTNFGSLVEFLTQDVQSPYYCPNQSSEKTMTKKVLLEKVKRVINNKRKMLAKDRGTDRIAAKVKRQLQLIT